MAASGDGSEAAPRRALTAAERAAITYWREHKTIAFHELPPEMHALLAPLAPELDSASRYLATIAEAFAPLRRMAAELVEPGRTVARTLKDVTTPGTVYGDRNRFIGAMNRHRRSRLPEEELLTTYALPLARYGAVMTHRRSAVRRYLAEWIARDGRAVVQAALSERYAAECIVVWNAGVLEDLYLYEVDPVLRRKARRGLVESLPLPPPGGKRFELVEPHVLEEPGLRQADDMQSPEGIDVAIARAAERRAFLVVESPETMTLQRLAAAVRLRPQEIALARLLARRFQGLPPAQRATLLADPAIRVELAAALGCTRATLRVFLSRLRTSARGW